MYGTYNVYDVYGTHDVYDVYARAGARVYAQVGAWVRLRGCASASERVCRWARVREEFGVYSELRGGY